MQFHVIAAIFSVLAASSQASPIAEARAIANAGMTFIGQVTPGGPVKVIKGTAKDILDEILRINPNYEKDFPVPSIEKRNYDGEPNCNIPKSNSGFSQPAKSRATKDNMSHLQRLGMAKCGVDPGNTCQRISCSYGSGIYFCNFNDHRIDYPCQHLANHVEIIIRDCTTQGPIFDYVHGEQVDTEGYKIVVSRAPC